MTTDLLDIADGFKGKVAIITGGASGIGAATSRLLARLGTAVVIADISAKAARDTAGSINEAGGTAEPFTTDVGVAAQVSEVVDFAVKTFGGLHFALNNAAVGSTGKIIGDLDEAEWHHSLDVCLHAVMYGLKYELPAIARSGGGAVVNTASIAGLMATYRNSAYVTAKHAVIGLTKAAALEYADQRIRVNSVSPGYIDTPLARGGTVQAQLDRLAARHPVGRLGRAEEVANLNVFLLSDAASFITGGNYVIDGGFTAGYAGSYGSGEQS